MRILKTTSFLLILAIALLLLGNGSVGYAQETTPDESSELDYTALMTKAQNEGSVRVIVGLDLPMAENLAEAHSQEADIAALQQTVENSLAGQQANVYTTYQIIPYMAMKVDDAALQGLIDSPHVTSIKEDVFLSPSLDSATAVIGAPSAWAAGHEGAGQTIVVLDTGIDAGHPFFGGRVVDEACFSNLGGSGGQTSLCPNGSGAQFGAGAADANTAACLDGGSQLCDHGTHVAGIAAGRNYAGGPGYSGVARAANIIGIQVFTRIDNPDICGDPADTPCVLTASSDYVKALEHVFTLDANYNIAAVNMSLGGGRYESQLHCDLDNSAVKRIIHYLRDFSQIATIIASGNDGWTDALGAPGCVTPAIAVGATQDDDHVANFSNMHQMVELLAPGVSIDSSVPGGGFDSFNGTSMATPMVAGAWAVVKGMHSANADVDDILAIFEDTGVSVTDSRDAIAGLRPAGSVTKPRISLGEAASFLIAQPPTAVELTELGSTQSAPLGAAIGLLALALIGFAGVIIRRK